MSFKCHLLLRAMVSPLLAVRVPVELNELITQRATADGLGRSKVVIAALEQYLRPSSEPNIHDILARLERLEQAQNQSS